MMMMNSSAALSNDPVECGPLWPHILLTCRMYIPGQIKSFTSVTPRDVLVLTDEGKLYGFGRNRDGMLGLGHRKKITQPKQITELEGKEIIEVQHGDSHVLALTKDGEVYGWGENKRGQCGTGAISDYILTPTKVEISEKFVSIRCGLLFSLALSTRGVVFGWGDNHYEQIGDSYMDTEFSPVRVQAVDSVPGIISIQCGSYHSLALTDHNEVYAWGSNQSGQLCSVDEETLREKVPITGVKAIAAGNRHSLFLTSQNKIYSCGDNEYGQLGSQTEKQFTGTPVVVPISFSLKTVAAYGNVSMALSNCCYIWGQVAKAKKVYVPRPTQFNSIDLAFSHCLKQSITPNLVPVKCPQPYLKNPLMDRITVRFNQSEGSDVQLVVQGKTLYAHRGYLQMVSPYFRQILADRSDKIITISDYPYSVLFAYVHYLYSGNLDASSDQIIQLLQLSLVKYPDPVLEQCCVNLLQTTITVVNCCQLYQLAVKHRLQSFEMFILQFIHHNLGLVFASNGYQEMDGQLCKQLSLGLSTIFSQQTKNSILNSSNSTNGPANK